MDKAAVYRISVKGQLPERYVERLGGLKIVNTCQTGTLLEGLLPDQAALMGILDALYALHLPIIEVVLIENCG
nr:hypothetical protein [uncultured Desulfobacter sp.]